MPVRRLKKEQAHLEITAFINLIVVLVPFLLSIAVFTHLSVIDLTLPAQQNEKLEKLTDNNLQLEVVIRPESIEVGDRIGGLIEPIPKLRGPPAGKALSCQTHGLQLHMPAQAPASVAPEHNAPSAPLARG